MYAYKVYVAWLLTCSDDYSYPLLFATQCVGHSVVTVFASCQAYESSYTIFSSPPRYLHVCIYIYTNVSIYVYEAFTLN